MRNLFVILAAGIILLFSGCISTEYQDFHVHADFAVFMNGQKMDFNSMAFMSDATQALDPIVHLHDGNPNVIHYHAQNISLQRFFNSLDMKWQNNCFNLGQGPACDDVASGKTWRLYVNGQLHTQKENYIAKDLDRILITYGNETPEQLQQQINSVTDMACIQSAKCPERGSPYVETCTTGGGCSVDLNNLQTRTCISIGTIKYCF